MANNKIVNLNKKKVTSKKNNVEVNDVRKIKVNNIEGEEFFGQVDYVGSDRIEGWLCRPLDLKDRLKVSILLDGREIVSGVANSFRNDLAEAKIGDGRYGFKLEVSSNILKNNSLKVVEAETLQVIKNGYVDKKISSKTKITSELPVLLIDLSDLFEYIENHDNLTGIQRVQVETITAIIYNAILPSDNVKFVIFEQSLSHFHEVQKSFLEDLLDDIKKNIVDRKFKRQSDNKIHLLNYYTPRNLDMAVCQSGRACLVMLGAGWIFQEYFIAVRLLKNLGVKFISVLYDLIPIKFPNICDRGTAEVFKIFLRKLTRNSDIVIGISQHTLLDYSEYCSINNLSRPRTSIFRIGQSENLVNSISQEDLCPVQGDFVLFVSTIEGRKNHQSALDIWKRLFAERGSQIPTLVFVGRLGWRVENLVEELHALNFLEGKVVILSDVSDVQLASLYTNCLFTVYPSLYEGWGLPVTESLSFGKVCLCSDRSSLPEAGNGFAVYYNVEDLNDGLQKVDRLLDDEVYRGGLEDKIKNEYVPISWSETAESLIVAAENILNAPSPLRSIPVIAPGEYSFCAISYQTDNLIQGQEVSRHFNDLFRPRLTNKKLTIDSYILAEECIGSGGWRQPDLNQRWLGTEGGILKFSINDNSINHILIFDITLPTFISSVVVETKHRGRLIDVWSLQSAENLLQLYSQSYTGSSDIEIEFSINSLVYKDAEIDSRKLSIGFRRLCVLDASSLEDRIIFLEKNLFNNKSSI
jgi:glycosyltransferase involved in cell wall biosynthesis